MGAKIEKDATFMGSGLSAPRKLLVKKKPSLLKLEKHSGVIQRPLGMEDENRHWKFDLCRSFPWLIIHGVAPQGTRGGPQLEWLDSLEFSHLPSNF